MEYKYYQMQFFCCKMTVNWEHLVIFSGIASEPTYQLEHSKLPQIIQAFGQQLEQAGWIPPGRVRPDTILWGEAAKGIWGLLSKNT